MVVVNVLFGAKYTSGTPDEHQSDLSVIQSPLAVRAVWRGALCVLQIAGNSDTLAASFIECPQALDH